VKTPVLPLAGAHIVCCAPNPWDDIWRNRQHIFSRLARANTVLYVEPRLYSLADVRRGEVPAEAWRAPRLRHWRDGLWLYRHPVWAPRTNWPGLRTLLRGLRGRAVRAAMAQLRFRDPIAWFFQPKDTELLGRLGERLVVFHIVDEYAAFRYHSPAAQAALREQEQQLLPRADLVITTSRALWDTKRQLNPQTVLVPNGVDFAAYEQVRQAGLPPPDDLASLPRPVIGYAGHISVRLDLTLLVELARRRPDWSVALVGSLWDKGCEAELACLRALPNVHFLGAKPAEAMPAYIAGFDAALIPYRPGEETQHISPIKLYEYLAAGKPIVTVDMPALDGFRHLVRLADSPAGFLAGVEAALSDTAPPAVAERLSVAAQHTWDRRVEQIAAFVRARLDGQSVRGDE